MYEEDGHASPERAPVQRGQPRGVVRPRRFVKRAGGPKQLSIVKPSLHHFVAEMLKVGR